MDFDVTREQWIDRFVIRMSKLRDGTGPDDFVALGHRLWPTEGVVTPEAAAEAEAAAESSNGGASGSGFAPTHSPVDDESPFEKTQRIPVERLQAEGEYVRDDSEWIARCVARVVALDPIIKAEEARRSVTDLAALERWRLMKPEAAADQLYTPIKPLIQPRQG